MDIDKKQLLTDYLDGRRSGNYDAFFRKAAEITDFILVRKYYSLTINADEHADLVQDCMVSLWEKILANKVNPDKGDLMSFIWQNSSYKILDYLKKKNRREKIVYFFSYEECITDAAKLKKNNGESEDDYYD